MVANIHAERPATARCVPSGRVADISAATARSGRRGAAPRPEPARVPPESARGCRAPAGRSACRGPPASSISLVINASGGEPCWIRESQLLPRVLGGLEHLQRPRGCPATGGSSSSVTPSGAIRHPAPANPDTAAACPRTPGTATDEHTSHTSATGVGRKSPVAPADWMARQMAIKVFSKRSSSSRSGRVVQQLAVGEIDQPQPRRQHAAGPQQRHRVELHLEHRLGLGEPPRLRRRLTGLVVHHAKLPGGRDVDPVDEPAQQGAVGEFDLDPLFAALGIEPGRILEPVIARQQGRGLHQQLCALLGGELATNSGSSPTTCSHAGATSVMRGVRIALGAGRP